MAANTFRSSDNLVSDRYIDAFQLGDEDVIEDVLGTVPSREDLSTFCKETGIADEYPDDVQFGKYLSEKLGCVRRDLVTAKAKHTVSGNGDSFSDDDADDAGDAARDVFSKNSSDFMDFLPSRVLKYAYKTLVGDVLTACVASMPEEAKSGSEHTAPAPEPPNAKRRKKQKSSAELEQAQWAMIESVTQTAASIARGRPAHAVIESPTAEHPDLLKHRVAMAAAKRVEAETESRLCATKEKTEQLGLFQATLQQFKSIQDELKNTDIPALEKVLQTRSEALLAVMTAMSESA